MPSTDAIRAMRFEEADLSSGDLVLQAEANESYQIMDIGVDGGNDESITEVTIGEESMIAFPSEDGESTLFREDSLQAYGSTLYGYMRNEGIPAPMLEVPEGDELVVSSTTSSESVTVKYREGNAALADAGAAGGPETKRRVYPVTGEGTATSVADATQATIELSDSLQPAQYDNFPFGTDCPSNREYDLLALALAIDGDTTGGTVDNFRLTAEEQRFIGKDSAFISADNAAYPALDPNEGPLIFPMSGGGPQTYSPGDELDIEVQATNTSGASGDLVVKATVVFDRRPI
jgi:hypothetical protein